MNFCFKHKFVQNHLDLNAKIQICTKLTKFNQIKNKMFYNTALNGILGGYNAT